MGEIRDPAQHDVDAGKAWIELFEVHILGDRVEFFCGQDGQLADVADFCAFVVQPLDPHTRRSVFAFVPGTGQTVKAQVHRGASL